MKTKQFFSMPAMLLLAGAMSMTSCDDVLGEWDRPTPQTPAVEPSVTYYAWDSESGSLKPKTITGGITNITETTTTWSGVCVVDKDVTITGDVTMADDVELIIADGAKLIINGKVAASTHDLKLYGQEAKSGQFVVDNSAAAGKAIEVKGLEIAGLKVNVTAPTAASDYAIYAQGKAVIYDGSVTTAGGHAIYVDGNDLEIYGGTHDLTSNAEGLSANTITFAGGTISITGCASGSGATNGVIRDGNVVIKTTITKITITNSNGISENKMQNWINPADANTVTFGENAAIVGSTWNAYTIADNATAISAGTYDGFSFKREAKVLTITAP